MQTNGGTGNVFAGQKGAASSGSISPFDAESLIKENASGTGFVVLDVRTSDEFSSGHLEKAINLDLLSPTFRSKLDGLERDNVYLVYCHSGNRGASALRTMSGMGFAGVYNISGGITAWQEAGLPLVR